MIIEPPVVQEVTAMATMTRPGCPAHCFCEIPEAELRPWVDRKYRKHISTVELLQSTDDPRQQEIISIVALFDVDENTLLEMMGDVDQPDHHIIHCRDYVKQTLGLDDSHKR